MRVAVLIPILALTQIGCTEVEPASDEPPRIELVSDAREAVVEQLSCSGFDPMEGAIDCALSAEWPSSPDAAFGPFSDAFHRSTVTPTAFSFTAEARQHFTQPATTPPFGIIDNEFVWFDVTFDVLQPVRINMSGLKEADLTAVSEADVFLYRGTDVEYRPIHPFERNGFDDSRVLEPDRYRLFAQALAPNWVNGSMADVELDVTFEPADAMPPRSPSTGDEVVVAVDARSAERTELDCRSVAAGPCPEPQVVVTGPPAPGADWVTDTFDSTFDLAAGTASAVAWTRREGLLSAPGGAPGDYATRDAFVYDVTFEARARVELEIEGNRGAISPCEASFEVYRGSAKLFDAISSAPGSTFSYRGVLEPGPFRIVATAGGGFDCLYSSTFDFEAAWWPVESR